MYLFIILLFFLTSTENNENMYYKKNKCTITICITNYSEASGECSTAART